MKPIEAFDELRWKIEVRTGMMLNHLLYFEDFVRRIARHGKRKSELGPASQVFSLAG